MTDDDQFRALFDDLHREIHAYASRRVPVEAAEDVVAETFLTVWRRWQDLPALHQDRRRWVFVTARHHLAHAQRARARRVQLESRLVLATAAGIPVVEPDVADQVVVSIDAFAAFRGLSPQDQEVIQLVAWEGLSLEDAAAVLGCSTAAYEARLRRARRRLLALLRHHGIVEPIVQPAVGSTGAAVATSVVGRIEPVVGPIEGGDDAAVVV